MKLSISMTFLVASLFIILDACTHQLPAQENTPCSLLNFRIINKTTDSLLARVRAETVVIDGQQLKIGESTAIRYTFDQQNRPIEDAYSAKGFSEYNGSETFEYGPNQLTVKTKNTSGASSEVKFPLNDQGLLVGAKYNADGFATEDWSDSYRTTHTIENGNIVRKETRAIVNNSLFSVVLYEYDLTKLNLPNVAPHKGKSSRNLPTKETRMAYSGNTGTPQPTTTIYAYTYIFDSSGRPSRRINKIADGKGTYEVVDFDYACRP